MDIVNLINQVIKDYFEKHSDEYEVPAKDLMSYFIDADIFTKDHRNGLPIRELLRKLDNENALHKIPYVYADRKLKNTNWYFRRITPKTSFLVEKKEEKARELISKNTIKPQKDKDEHYVLNLCDEVLQLIGIRQKKFDFLKGDSGTKLPVDVYYPTLELVIEYRETQHTNEVKFFDKLDKMTVSGVSRGEQRKIYDQRRREVLPEYGIKLIEIDYSAFEYDRNHKIVRNREKNLEVVKRIFKMSHIL